MSRHLVLDRLLAPTGADVGDLHPFCHGWARLSAIYERGGRLHLYCGQCFKPVLMVEIR